MEDEDKREDVQTESVKEETSMDTPKKVKVGKVAKARSNSKVRLAIILVLMAIVAGLFIFWGKARIFLAGIFVALLLALGLEVSGNDWDLGKLIETGSLSESKVEKTESGRWLIDDRCKKEAVNCDNFEYQEDAQDMFEYCGGPESDIHGLDGDDDGEVCEALPSNQ